MSDYVGDKEKHGRKLPGHVQRAIDAAESSDSAPIACDACASRYIHVDVTAGRHRAQRRCPACKWRLCNAHSMALSTMETLENSGKRRCSNCGTISPEELWLNLTRTERK